MYVSVNAIFYVNIKAKIITESFNGAQKICQIEKKCNIIDWYRRRLLNARVEL